MGPADRERGERQGVELGPQPRLEESDLRAWLSRPETDMLLPSASPDEAHRVQPELLLPGRPVRIYQTEEDRGRVLGEHLERAT